MNIPLPTLGHWARIAAGHVITPVPLPIDAERTSFTSSPPEQQRPGHNPEDETWLAERRAFEVLAENRCGVDLTPHRWHKAVAPLREQLRSAAKEVDKSRRDSERQAKNPRAQYAPDFTGWRWTSFLRSGQILLETHKSCAMRVSPGTYERALAILNALCSGAEQRGFAADLDSGKRRIVLDGHPGEVEVRITEKLQEEWRKEPNWAKKVENVKHKVPTGILRLYVGATYAEKEFADTPGRPLESRLNDIFVGVYERVVRARERQRENDLREREWKEEEKRREAAEARRRAELARKEAERRRREALVAEARAWKTARLIREYVNYRNHAEPGNRSENTPDAEWTAWALKVADDLDPA